MITKTCGHTTNIAKGTPLTADVCGVCWLWVHRQQFSNPKDNTQPYISTGTEMRPCEFRDENHCRLCWLWFNSDKHREKWERLTPFDPNYRPPVQSPPCDGCKPAETPKPTFIQKVKSFKTAYETWVEAGRPITPDDEFAKRRALCDGCEHKTANDECGKCGCPLEKPGWMVRLLTDSPGKLRMASETCPAGKWGAVSTEA